MNKVNSIKVKIDKSDYQIYDDFPNFQIDGFWLDEKLDELYPKHMYKGLIPTLLPAIATAKEKDIVWDRILPRQNSKSICPILMCPDDCDFSCTLIVAEIENDKESIRWNKLGIDKTQDFESEKIGSEVDWFEKVNSFEFSKMEYKEMMSEFRRHLS